MSTLNYIDENGNINKAGVIPKNYPASKISYNNSQSGLSATKVQGAIDELRSADNIMMSDGVTSVESAITNIVMDSISISDLGALSNGASGYKSGTCPTHSGYTPVVAVAQASRIGAVGGNLMTNCSLSGNTYYVNYKAFDSISATNSVINVYIYYQKS